MMPLSTRAMVPLSDKTLVSNTLQPPHANTALEKVPIAMRLSFLTLMLLFSISVGRGLITTSVSRAPAPRASRAPAPRACASPARIFPQDLNLIYDSKCGVCQWEVDFLRSRDSEGRLTYTDLESEDFEEGVPRNGYLTYETALASFHAVKADGTLLKGMPVFQEAYAAVGLGWVWNVYNNPLAARFLDFGYSIFARYRTDLTRGSSLEALYAARKVARAGEPCPQVSQEPDSVL